MTTSERSTLWMRGQPSSQRRSGRRELPQPRFKIRGSSMVWRSERRQGWREVQSSSQSKVSPLAQEYLRFQQLMSPQLGIPKLLYIIILNRLLIIKYTFMKYYIKFLICLSGIFTCYILSGLIVETIYKQNFGTPTNPSPKFTYTFTIMVLQMAGSTFIALLMIRRNRITFTCNDRQALLLGLVNFASTFTALASLEYISFPVQAVSKSCKVLSILIVGIALGKVSFTKQQIICGLLMTLGIIVFHQSEKQKAGGPQTQFFGIVLLFVSLCADGFLATKQTEYKATKHIENWEMAYHTGKYGFLFSLLYGVLSTVSTFFTHSTHDRKLSFLQYINAYPASVPYILGASFFMSIGQIFIFYCIKAFSPRVLAIITTSRKFFTILISIFFYNHHVDLLQWGAIAIVAIALIWELESGVKHHQTKPHKHQPHYEKVNSK